MPTRSRRSPVGTVLAGTYRLTRPIAEGGMGTVYEAMHLRLNRRFAVKLLSHEAADSPEGLARFRREADLTSQLSHPHLIQVADFGTTDGGEPYLVMEYLEGEDLERRLHRVGRFTLPSAVRVVQQVASALSASHAKGIVHRDLKPANIFLLDIEGEPDFVKVVDFGISKSKRNDTQLTATSVVMGTPRYMSPEQAMGKANGVDHRSDQWALAAVAWEMLAGQPPFIRGDVTALLHAIAHEKPPALAHRIGALPAEVERTLLRALAKRPSDRFPTVVAFARAFEAAAARPIATEQPERTSRLTFLRRRPGPTAAPPVSIWRRLGHKRRWVLGLGLAVPILAGVIYTSIASRSAATTELTGSAGTKPRPGSPSEPAAKPTASPSKAATTPASGARPTRAPRPTQRDGRSESFGFAR